MSQPPAAFVLSFLFEFWSLGSPWLDLLPLLLLLRLSKLLKLIPKSNDLKIMLLPLRFAFVWF